MKKLLILTRSIHGLFHTNLKMKLTGLFSLIALCTMNANNTYAQNKVTIVLEDTSIKRFIDEIEKSTEFRFVYKVKDVDLNRRISISANNEPINIVLDRVFDMNETSFSILENQIYLTKRMVARAKSVVALTTANLQATISGTITDKDGLPLAGANILEKGTTNGTQADFDGNFSITVSDENAILVISYIGFSTQEIPIDGQNNLAVSLEEDTANLDEVIVVGFGEQSARKVTAAIAQVSGEELGIEERPVTNIQSAIIGSLSGLTGFNNNGSPGAAPSFNIRGTSSLNGTSPLVIIDDFEGSLSDVNPQDIQSITVLKDAAAVAVYGVRGANGVLLVTTKKTGKNKRISVGYNYSGSVQTPTPLPTTLTASELIAFENFAVTGDPTGGGNASAPYSQAVINLANNGFYPETQWPSELYNSSSGQQSHNITLQGGNENIGFLMSAGHLNQEGLVIGADNFRRMNLRLKIDADITDWLSVGTNTVITNRVTNITPATGGNGLLGSPLFPVQTVDGFFVDKGSPGEANPIAQANSGSFNKSINDGLNIQLYSEVKPFKNFSLEQRISFVKTNINTRDWSNVYDFVRLDFSDSDSYTNPDSANRDFVPGIPDARRLRLFSSTGYTATALTRLNYKVNFGDHNLGVLLGFQTVQGESENFQTGRTGFFLDNVIDLELGQQTDVALGGGLGNTSFRGGNATTESYFGRLNYDFKGKYVAELAFRYDGSSAFLDSNQWGFFPSASLAWNIAEESFMDNIDFVDQLKLRGSYGIAGDDSGIERSVIQFADVDITGYPFGGVVQPGIFLGTPASRDLEWETASIFNAGLDFSLWRGKFQLSSEYFINNRDNILDFAIVPTEFGFGNVPANLFAAKSWGWEFDLSHKNTIGDNFSYWLGGNITYYDNEITDLDGRETPDQAVGQSINQWLGFETDGFFDNQDEIDAYVGPDGTTTIDQSGVGGTSIGGFKYIDQLTVDTDGDGEPDATDGVIDGDDRVILERNSDTNLNIGFNLGMAYKGLTLSARFYGALQRNQWFNEADAHEPFLNGTNAFTYQTDYWSPDNPNATFPVPQGNGIQGYNSDVSHFIFDNEFIKLQNVTLSYDFDQRTLDSIGFLQALNLTLSIENIGVVWTNSPIRDSGWDPELGAGNVDYPLPVTTSLGLNVRF